MRKTIKILGYAASIIFVIVFFGGLAALWKMPSAADLGRAISRNGTAGSSSTKTHADSELSPKPLTPKESTQDLTAPVSTQETQENKQPKTKMMVDLMDASQDKSQVCAHLINFRMLPAQLKYDGPTLGKRLEDAMSAEIHPKDPVAMAIMAPLRLFFQQPKVQKLIQEVTDAAEKGEKDSLVGKASFYKNVYSAYEEMKTQQGAAEAVMDREYYLVMMAKAIQQNPSLVSDPRLQDYCQSIEKAANDNIPVILEVEKSEFMSFLDYSKVKPSDIGYDPNYKTRLQFEYSTEGIRIHGGWIESLIQ